jgi:cyclopropane fatty-acyl-phospholipid synthase-like methyltransferase
MGNDVVRRVIGAYDDLVVRAYCRVRFLILRQRFLDEIGQYLPANGIILDIGCGFGLFSLYYASVAPGRSLRGLDLDVERIRMARSAAVKLGLGNVTYEAADASDFEGDGRISAAYLLDIVHHIPPEAVFSLLSQLYKCLEPGGHLLVKDVDVKPAWKRLFTWVLDKAMAPATPVRYWSSEELTGVLEAVGFRVRRHQMVDGLPYPHVLYVCQKAGNAR